jgi:hypothetical protein
LDASLVLFTKSNPTFDLFSAPIISLVIAPFAIEVVLVDPVVQMVK